MSIYNDVDSRVQAYKGNPAALMKRYGMSQNLLDMLAYAKVMEMQASAKGEMIAQMAQQQGQQPTVAEALEQGVMENAKSEANPTRDVAQQTTGIAQNNQRQQQAALKQIMQAMQGQGQQSPLMSGIAAAPGAGNVRMAGGGIVAFAGPDGSYVDIEEERRARERERRRHAMSDWGVGRATPAAPHALSDFETVGPVGPRETPPPPPRQEAPAAPPSAVPAARETGLGYLRSQAPRTQSDLARAYDTQAQADLKIDPEESSRRIRDETEAYLAGPKAQEEARARAAEVERRRGVLAESERNAPRRELIQALIGAGGRTSGLGALTAAGASGLNASLQQEAARERGLRDIFGLEEEARGLEASRRSAAQQAGATARTEATRARTSALSSAGQFLNTEERNRLSELQMQAEAIDRENARLLDVAKLKQSEGALLDQKKMADYNAAQERYRKIETDIERARNLPTGPYARAVEQLKQADSGLKTNPKNETYISLRNSAVRTINSFETNMVERLQRAQLDVDTMAKRAGIASAPSGGLNLDAINAAIARKQGQ